MRAAPLPTHARKALLPALAALALACTAPLAAAATASVSITSVTVSAEPFSGTYAWLADPYQSYSLSALQAGGTGGADSAGFSADDWAQGSNLLAQTASAKASANTVVFTDPMTQLGTAGFNLGAYAQAAGGVSAQMSNYAEASSILAGSFKLVDGFGDPAVGTLTFDVYYDIGVDSQGGTGATYGQSLVSLLSSTDSGGSASFSDGLLSNTLAGGAGTASGHFSWTFTLTADDTAYFTLGGSAIAAAVPEAPTVALWAAGLLATLPLARRRAGAPRA